MLMPAILPPRPVIRIGSKGWRRTQALAQMKAAGFRLPERTKGGRRSVALWAFGLALWEQFWPIVTEAAAAGLGAALGLSLCLLISTLIPATRRHRVRVQGLRPATDRSRPGHDGSRGGARRVVGRGTRGRASPGSWAGHRFRARIHAGARACLAPDRRLWPRGTRGGRPPIADYFLNYVVGGAIWGLGIAIGLELGTRFPARRSLGRAFLGGGLGGATATLLIMGLAMAMSLLPVFDGLTMKVPLVESPGLTSGTGSRRSSPASASAAGWRWLGAGASFVEPAPTWRVTL